MCNEGDFNGCDWKSSFFDHTHIITNQDLGSLMKVALSAADEFVAPYISEMLGDSLVTIPDEALEDSNALDALLTPCSSLIHINSRPVDTSVARDDRGAIAIMRERARPILTLWIDTDPFI